MKDILFVYFNDIGSSGGISGFELTSQEGLDFVWQYELESKDFSAYKGIILSGGVDQILLSKLGERLFSFINEGGRMFFNGHVEKKFLPMLNIYEPITNIKYPDFAIALLNKHRVYKGLDIANFNEKKGVAGFYSRGQNPPPNGARIITAIKQASVPSDWELTLGKGKLYTHAGVDLHIAASADDTKACMENIIAYLRGEDE